MHAHFAGAVPLDLLQQERSRITSEINVAKARLQSASASFVKVEETVALAVDKAQNCHKAT